MYFVFLCFYKNEINIANKKKKVCEWYDFVFLENVTSRAQVQVSAPIKVMKDNNTSSTELFDSRYYIIW